jgi:two-component system LytT family response regulator
MAKESNSFSVIENTKKINYVEKCEGYTIVTLSNTAQIISDFSLEKLENILPSNEFIRVHKSFIIKISFLSEIVQIGNSHQAILKNGKRIPISKRKKSILLNKLIPNN